MYLTTAAQVKQPKNRQKHGAVDGLVTHFYFWNLNVVDIDDSFCIVQQLSVTKGRELVEQWFQETNAPAMRTGSQVIWSTVLMR